MPNKAQSLLELMAVITIVALTILVIGPTVIRGVNAHFKLWDDTVQDSHNDPLKQAPPTGLPGECVCGDEWHGGPGQRCGVGGCAPTERLETRLCNPPGCGAALGHDVLNCIPDPLCCSIVHDTPDCCFGTDFDLDSPDNPLNCPLGHRVQKKDCGTDVEVYSYRVDNSITDGNPSCVPKCLGVFWGTVQAGVEDKSRPVLCDGDSDDFPENSPLIQDDTGIGLPIRPRGTGEESCLHTTVTDPDQKCEVYCLPPYTAVGTACKNECTYWTIVRVDTRQALKNRLERHLGVGHPLVEKYKDYYIGTEDDFRGGIMGEDGRARGQNNGRFVANAVASICKYANSAYHAISPSVIPVGLKLSLNPNGREYTEAEKSPGDYPLGYSDYLNDDYGCIVAPNLDSHNWPDGEGAELFDRDHDGNGWCSGPGEGVEWVNCQTQVTGPCVEEED